MENEKQSKKIEGFDGELLHPSLDIKDGILVLGFRYRAKSGKDEDIAVMVCGGTLATIFDDTFIAGGKLYCLEKRDRRLIRLNDRWSLERLNALIQDHDDLTKNISLKPKDLFESVVNLLKRCVGLETDEDYYLVSAWIIGTYFHPVFHSYPFLNPKAPKGSGKSQLLNLLRQLCFNAVKASPTVAALGDTVDALRGVYLIDQADSLGKRGNENLLDIITDSYKRGGGKRRVMSVDKGKRNILEFETYGPKALASIKDLPGDLRDRCFIVPLMKSRGSFLNPDEDSGIWVEARDKLYRFLIASYTDIASEYLRRRAEYRSVPEVSGRTLELWLPIEVILRSCGMGDEMVLATRNRFLAQYGFAEPEPSELDVAVIQAILDSFGSENVIRLSPQVITKSLDSDLFPAYVKPPQRATRVGWVITNFNLSSDKKRSKGGVSYVFEKTRVEDIYAKYFSTSPTPDEQNDDTTDDSDDVGPPLGDTPV